MPERKDQFSPNTVCRLFQVSGRLVLVVFTACYLFGCVYVCVSMCVRVSVYLAAIV